MSTVSSFIWKDINKMELHIDKLFSHNFMSISFSFIWKKHQINQTLYCPSHFHVKRFYALSEKDINKIELHIYKPSSHTSMSTASALYEKHIKIVEHYIEKPFSHTSICLCLSEKDINKIELLIDKPSNHTSMSTDSSFIWKSHQ